MPSGPVWVSVGVGQQRRSTALSRRRWEGGVEGSVLRSFRCGPNPGSPEAPGRGWNPRGQNWMIRQEESRCASSHNPENYRSHLKNPQTRQEAIQQPPGLGPASSPWPGRQSPSAVPGNAARNLFYPVSSCPSCSSDVMYNNKEKLHTYVQATL